MKSFLAIAFSLFLGLFLLPSCTKNLSTESIESRIIGSWKVKEVKYSKNGRANYKNVTANFHNYKFNFMVDGTLVCSDLDTDTNYDGMWYIYEEWVWDEDDQQDELVQTVIMSVWDASVENIRDFRWKDISISSRKLKCREHRNGGKYKWELVQ